MLMGGELKDVLSNHSVEIVVISSLYRIKTAYSQKFGLICLDCKGSCYSPGIRGHLYRFTMTNKSYLQVNVYLLRFYISDILKCK